ncbi:protein qutG [Sordaria brevicollis]|uniref:Inositol-1-monophosphatase n=1 Tax=Sordaria brevicollis TaxID=83679 RepID=A0AAE0U5E4_SORBR|nr:protein qutG [Sordaria brevicollis]
MVPNTITEAELDGIYAFAVQLGKDAGHLLMEAARSRFSSTKATNEKSTIPEFTEKDSAVDIVTQTDEEVEAFIKTAINTRYPSHHFIGEETYAKSSQPTRPYLVDPATPTWVIDPLDGTVNYTHLFPMFCVSIAFLIDGIPVIGVICAPMLGQLFTSCKGRGAWLNETQRLPLVRQPLPRNAPAGCVFSCEWGKDRKDRPDGNLYRKVDSFVNMAVEVGGRGGKGGMVHGVRSLGSATLDLAYTAMGSFDIWWEGGCWEWDVAAGMAILHEAGGLITSANPPEAWETAEIPEAKLGSRLYLAIRPAGPSEWETARTAQERTVRAVWRRVRALDYTRPGA